VPGVGFEAARVHASSSFESQIDDVLIARDRRSVQRRRFATSWVSRLYSAMSVMLATDDSKNSALIAVRFCREELLHCLFVGEVYREDRIDLASSSGRREAAASNNGVYSGGGARKRPPAYCLHSTVA
jgi:hypothetical protein